jgi:3-oxoacyl-[acyl-carrier protein] reductase
VRALVEDGYRVVAADLTENHMKSLCDELNSAYGEQCVIPVALDVSNSQQCHQIAAKVKREWGTVSVLVNNAGVLSRAKLEATTPEEWATVMSVNVGGYFYLAREFLGGMKEQGWGRIVMTGSMAAKTGGVTAGTAYSVSKGAVHALTVSIARECAGSGNTCVCVTSVSNTMSPLKESQ